MRSGARVDAVRMAARNDQDVSTARDAVVAWSRDELLPHAAAEEQTIYAAAAAKPEGRLLVEALVADHHLIGEQVERLAGAPDAVAAASAAAALEALFLVHLAKENEQVLPLLAADPAIAVSDLLEGMHRELVGDEGDTAAVRDRLRRQLHLR